MTKKDKEPLLMAICPRCNSNSGVHIWNVYIGHGKATDYVCLDCGIVFGGDSGLKELKEVE